MAIVIRKRPKEAPRVDPLVEAANDDAPALAHPDVEKLDQGIDKFIRALAIEAAREDHRRAMRK